MATVITAYIYRPSISKELKVLYRHIIFFWGVGEKERREEQEDEGKEGERKGE